MPYKGLGWRNATGQADTTGTNPGNWTVTFDSAALFFNYPEVEVYKIVVTGAAQGATFNVAINTALWDLAVYAVQNSWDPQQPLPIHPGDTLYFYYTSAATDGHKPSVTIWLRYEVALASIFGGG